MSRKPYLLLSGTIFLVVALLHLLRLFAGEPVTIGTTVVPLWLSWFGFAAAAALGLWAHSLARKEPT